MPSEWVELHSSGERLRWAIDRQPHQGRRRGLRLLVHKLEAQGIKGATLPSITAYIEDRRKPSLGFWIPTAKALGVRVEWLAFGTGQPSREHEVVASINATAEALASEAGQEWRRTAASMVRAITGRDPDPRVPHPYWVAPLYDFLLLRDGVPYDGGNEAQQLAKLGAALRAPLKALDMSPEDMGASAFSDYVMRMVPVLFGLAADRAQRTAAAEDVAYNEARHRRALQANAHFVNQSAKTNKRRKKS